MRKEAAAAILRLLAELESRTSGETVKLWSDWRALSLFRIKDTAV
ncbi:hypothetical protein ACFQI7_15635 [Paenibacillus allorhizosphaerae]|uniref:Uncharacterized protein n=1 Tax=Paenibacillus allorhizosphaerae TaxID=2849866 RepID=A0ABM8VDT9_9BACL|nr:hypothetical protein [Paenibacillus allorhizosphaerae]CAG7628885.1 hypothetical protein PAECIP111802_01503 [Paenibacillus allorhizosphaerae]